MSTGSDKKFLEKCWAQILISYTLGIILIIDISLLITVQYPKYNISKGTAHFFFSSIFQGLSALIALILMVVIYFNQLMDRKMNAIENRIIDFFIKTTDQYYPLWSKRFEWYIDEDRSKTKFKKIGEITVPEDPKEGYTFDQLYFEHLLKHHDLHHLVSKPDLKLKNKNELEKGFTDALIEYRKYCNRESYEVEGIIDVVKESNNKDQYLIFLLRYHKIMDPDSIDIKDTIKGLKNYYYHLGKAKKFIKKELRFYHRKRSDLKDKMNDFKENAKFVLLINAITIGLSALFLLALDRLYNNNSALILSVLLVFGFTIIGLSFVIKLSIKGILTRLEIIEYTETYE